MSGWTSHEEMNQDYMPPEQTAASGGPVVKWADPAMYTAAPMTAGDEPVMPKVTLVSMTANPLKVIAAASQMYRGDPVHSIHDISRGLALSWFRDMGKTNLKAPLEFVDLHFLIEGVTRAFTHQLVRQRTAVYTQESMRFAVKENAALEIMMPPSISTLKGDDPRRVLWDRCISLIAGTYNDLVNSGIPAEDARGLLPTNITTRVNYKTNLRNLAEQAGMRLCSQAQYEWKQVWNEMIQAILEYGSDADRWQQREIVKMFKPVCYRTGKCEFMAETDRYCSIRERVEAHHQAGDTPDTWTDINPQEPLLYRAARRG